MPKNNLEGTEYDVTEVLDDTTLANSDELLEYQDELEEFDDDWFGNEDLDTDWDVGLLDDEFDDE